MIFDRKTKEPPAAEAGLVIEISDDLRAVVDRAQQATDEQQRIEAALTAARRDLAAIEVERAAANARLSESESGSALDGAEPDKTVRKQVASLRDQAEFAAAKVSGLEGRLRIASDAVATVRAEVRFVWTDWQCEIAEQFQMDIYAGAVARFLEVLNVGAALASASDVPSARRLYTLQNTVLVLPGQKSNPLRRGAWKSDPAAMEIQERFRALRELVAPHLGEAARTVAEDVQEEQPADLV